MTKKIAIDARMMFSSGIGTYIRNLLPLILQYYKDRDVEFYILGYPEDFVQCPWLSGARIKTIRCESSILSVREQFEIPRLIPKGMDLFWAPNFNIPVLYTGPMLVTVHDLFFLGMSRFVKDARKVFYASFMFKNICRRARDIICVSHFTENELLDLFTVDRRKVQVIQNGIDLIGFHNRKGTRPYPNPYLLYVGNVKPHKNLRNLFKAFDLIADRIPHHLVVVGKKEGFITSDHRAIAESRKFGERIYFTGHVSGEDLQRYLAHAEAMVFPSLYEGFGLPPLEAMACDCPVIASHAASLQEVGGDAVLYTDPYSAQDMADSILKLLTNPKMRQQLVERGRENLKRFSWQKAALQTAAIIDKYI